VGEVGILALAGLVLILDLAIPLGIAIGILYVLVILGTLRFHRPSLTLTVGLISGVLIALGCVGSPDGPSFWPAIVNRIFSIMAVALVTFIVLQQIRMLGQLTYLQKTLEQKVNDRTTELDQQRLATLNLLEDIDKARTDLERKDLLLENILTHSQTPIYVKDVELRYVLVNPAFAEGFGRTAEDFIGKTDAELFEPSVVVFIRRGETEALAQRTAVQFEQQMSLHSGPRTWLSTKFPLVGSGGEPFALCGLATDITELAQARNFLHRVVEAAPSGIIMIDPEGCIRLANRQVELMFGYSRRELEKLPVEVLIPQRYRAGHEQYRREFFANPQTRPMGTGRELYGLRKDGTEFPIEIGLNPIQTVNGLRVISSIIDITERKKAEQALLIWTEALEKSNKELDDFAYIASHDLKEPLRGIKMYANFLTEDFSPVLGEEGKRKCETIIHLSQRMEELIQSLLYFSRVGRTELAVGPVDLNGIVSEVLETLNPRLQEEGMEVRIPRPLPTVTCDKARVAEVFRNLITNAMKYNDKPEKWIEVGYLSPETDPEHCSNQMPLEYYVRDNGIGIPEKHSERVFGMFKRLHGRDKFGGGTGAGLTIVQKIVERHGGRIWIQSTVGEGTTMWFTLEAVRTSEQATAMSPPVEQGLSVENSLWQPEGAKC